MNPNAHDLTKDLPKQDQLKIQKVLEFSEYYLAGITRRGGETYADHCEEVARVLKESSPSASLLCVALLHDLLVHPDGKDILHDSPLTEKERELVVNMHQLRRLHIDENTNDLDTVIGAFMEQPELLPLRMAHRVNDIRHIDRFTSELQKQIAQETLHMYAAIAGRLGMQCWRVELEDGSFPLLQPSIVDTLQKQFHSTSTADTVCLNHTKAYLEDMFKKKGLNAIVGTRVKGLYSTYRKMVIKDRAFEDLTDRLALRIITKSPAECYEALGIVHAAMNPIPGKLKDYIGAPKENGYQSIHTVVFPLPGVTEQPMELQIRTAEMHRDCEYGSAAHSEYKKGMYTLKRKVSRVNLFRNLQHLREEVATPQQFEEALRKYFREDHIAIFNPENIVHHIRVPATAMDFVCMTYPQKCSKLKEVRINGRKQDMGTPLHDGDTIEARFSRESTATAAWVQSCFHGSAKKKLRSILRLKKISV